MRTLVFLLATVLAWPAAAQTLEKIRKSGTITLGFIDGAAPFSSVDENGAPQGYSIDLCRAAADAIAVQLKRASLRTRWVKLTIQNRIDAVRRGQVDGFAADRTTLIGVVAKGGGGDIYKLLDEDFSIEQYALMLPRGDPDFRLAVNRGLAQLYRSGEIRRVYDRWLGPLGPPSLLLSATYFIQALSE